MMLASVLILQLVIPLGLLAWLASGGDRSRAAWLLKVVLVGGYLAAVGVAGVWLILPWYVPLLYLVLFLLALVRTFHLVRERKGWPRTRRGWIGLGLRGAFAVGFGALGLYALSGWRPPEEPIVELGFPLAGGTYYVANGGSNGLLNPHLKTRTGASYRAYRGQSYALDFVKLNRWGFRARGLAPQDPEAYAIFGDPVYAPCSGDVVRAVEGLPDLSPPKTDREHMEGNHVLLDCGAAWVLLAHLQQGSLRVQEGDSVARGQPLGRVGNTGNTSEPHLHIHAQRPGFEDVPLGGDPLPVRFEGRYLSRNARVRSRN